MKFKQVEISAFRIYDNPADATFDFSLPEGGIADFVSLYAPNGFGKTSFYDAIEWGVTNNIQRFWQNSVITEKSLTALKDNNNDTQIKLWRNKTSGRNTYVKITRDDQQIIERQLVVHGNSDSDVTKQHDIENKPFRQVILSQEWISAFLKEVNGERRYQIFMENPDLQPIDSYYKGTKELASVCRDRIGFLHQKINTAKLKIVLLTEENLLEIVNQQITLLNASYSESIELLKLTSTEKDVLKLTNFVSGRLVINQNQSSRQAHLADANSALAGKEGLLSIEQYFSLLQELVTVIPEIEKATGIILKFQKVESLANELNSLNQKQQEWSGEIEKLTSLKQDFPKYLDVIKRSKEKQDERTRYENELKQFLEIVEAKGREEIRLRTDISKILVNNSSIKDRLSKLPQLKISIESSRIELNQRLASFNESKIKIDQTNELISKKEAEIKALDGCLSDIKKGNYTSLPDAHKLQFLKTINEVSNAASEKDVLNKSFKNLDENIVEQQSLNSTIEAFIQNGLKIVNESKTSACPLCEQMYDSYEQLAEKISNNKALSSILQGLLNDRTGILDQIAKLDKTILDGRKLLSNHYDVLKQVLANELIAARNNLTTFEREQDAISEFIKQIRKTETENSKAIDNLTVAEFETKLTDLQNKNNREIEELNKQLASAETDKANAQAEVNARTTNIVLANNERSDLLKDEKYLQIIKWFQQFHPTKEISESILNSEIEKANAAVERLRKDIAENERTTNSIKNELAPFDLTGVTNSKSELETKKQNHEKNISHYKNFLRSALRVETDLDNKNKLTSKLKELEANDKAELEKAAKLTIEYQKLEKYFANLVPFLQSEVAKAEVEKLEKELEFMVDTVKPFIETEKQRIRDFLSRKIKTFFYTDLINTIYNKIDPHPDFKGVEFKPVFDSDTPRLDIFVVNESDEEKLIPNLYFSTAQINILSLSIFLATALNSKEYDCIFIDDPIQSMDSINVLSTIDLIRSIVQNEKKQIILSTHDENFHNLLSKKIPAGRFKSKYLHLETFGKVSSEIATNTVTETLSE
jgi:exonuclease SbcC